VTDSDSHIEISLAAVDAFARASHDRNPLHVSDAYARSTPFGRRVVHGMLATLVCLGKAPARPGERVARLKVEFTAPLFVGVPYRAEMAVTAERTTVRLHDGKRVTLKLVLEMAHGARTAAPLHVEGLAGEAPRRSLRDLPVGFALDGRYGTSCGGFDVLAEHVPLRPDAGVGPFERTVLMAVSWLVGMQAPGERALFSRAVIDFFICPRIQPCVSILSTIVIRRPTPIVLGALSIADSFFFFSCGP